MSAGPVLGFECEWYDNVSGQLTTLFLKFFLDDNTIEILTEGTRCLLKRIFYADVTARDLFVGNSITVFNRQLIIKKYCNEATVRYMGAREEHYLIVVPASSTSSSGNVVELAKSFSLKIGKVRTVTCQLPATLDVSASTGDIIFEFVGYDKSISSNFVRAASKQCPHAAVATIEAIAEVFQYLRKNNVYVPLRSCSLCLVKPHVIKEERLGELLNSISSAGYHLESLFMIHLTLPMANELLDVYKDVYPSFVTMVDQAVSSPVIAIRITSAPRGQAFSEGKEGDYSPGGYVGEQAELGGDLVEGFRSFCGPLNSELASRIRPGTLRALYGYTQPGANSYALNAVHCTDLPDDGEMECRYFFGLLAGL